MFTHVNNFANYLEHIGTGLPHFTKDGKAEFMPFNIFPLENTPLPKDKDGWLLFLDEFNSATKMVQAAA